MSVTGIDYTVIEKELSIQLHPLYRKFIEKFGDYEKNGLEVYGYSPQYVDIEKIPCVIGATRQYRDALQLDQNEIVLAHTGVEDIVAVLDNSTGKVFEVTVRSRELVANTFDDWLKKTVGISIEEKG